MCSIGPTVAEGRGAILPLEKPVINKRGAAPQHPFQWLCPLVRYPTDSSTILKETLGSSLVQRQESLFIISSYPYFSVTGEFIAT